MYLPVVGRRIVELQQISDVSHMQREITFGSTSDSFPTTLRVPDLIQYKIIFQPLAPLTNSPPRDDREWFPSFFHLQKMNPISVNTEG